MRKRSKSDSGLVAVEYVLIISFVCLIAVGAFAMFQPKIETMINGISFTGGSHPDCPAYTHWDNDLGFCAENV